MNALKRPITPLQISCLEAIRSKPLSVHELARVVRPAGMLPRRYALAGTTLQAAMQVEVLFGRQEAACPSA